MSLAQFAKRLTKSSKRIEYDNDELFEAGTDVIIPEELDNEDSKSTINGQDIESDTIIAYNSEQRANMKQIYKIGGSVMRLRKPLVLRFHKFKQTKDPHQFYFSQLRLYHPHSVIDLEVWEDDLDRCLKAYNEAKDAIAYVKSIVMKYQDKVESAQSKAQEEFDHYIGDILDAEKEQEEDDSAEEGTVETEEFMALDPDDANTDKIGSDNESKCIFKKIEL